MPIGILIIKMKDKRLFSSARQLYRLTDSYFIYIEGEYQVEERSGKKEKVYTRRPEPPTISGLALYLGFNSRAGFEAYCVNGKYAPALQRSKLRIEAEYEKRLHQQSPTGAIFVLKSLGWDDKPSDRLTENTARCLDVNVFDTGVPTAASEKEVLLAGAHEINDGAFNCAMPVRAYINGTNLL